MTQEDKVALKEFLFGASVAIGLTVVFLVIIFASGIITTESEKDTPSSAKVVDTYKGCDIVQWHYGPLAEYHYFLHCNNTRPVYEK
jgi:hypothetical protein